jgi:hypothetical protein
MFLNFLSTPGSSDDNDCSRRPEVNSPWLWRSNSLSLLSQCRTVSVDDYAPPGILRTRFLSGPRISPIFPSDRDYH